MANWAIVCDGGVSDRFPTQEEANEALAKGGYPNDAEVSYEPEDEV